VRFTVRPKKFISFITLYNAEWQEFRQILVDDVAKEQL